MSTLNTLPTHCFLPQLLFVIFIIPSLSFITLPHKHMVTVSISSVWFGLEINGKMFSVTCFCSFPLFLRDLLTFMYVTKVSSSSLLYSEPLYSWISCYIIDWHLGCFHCFAVKDSASMTISVHISWGKSFSISGLPSHGNCRKWHHLYGIGK